MSITSQRHLLLRVLIRSDVAHHSRSNRCRHSRSCSRSISSRSISSRSISSSGSSSRSSPVVPARCVLCQSCPTAAATGVQQQLQGQTVSWGCRQCTTGNTPWVTLAHPEGLPDLCSNMCRSLAWQEVLAMLCRYTRHSLNGLVLSQQGYPPLGCSWLL
jgi:hypothetical protein